MPRSRARNYAEKREAILHSAALVFARDGYDRASMAGLAAECGVSKALLYHYYASKEALLFGILSNHLQLLVDGAESADKPDLMPEERLGRLVGALLDAYRDADAEHKVQINALRLLPEPRQAELKALERKLVAIFSDAIHAVEPTVFENGRLLKPVTMSLFGMLNWFYMWFREGGPVSRAEYAALATKMLLSGVRGLDRAGSTTAASRRLPTAPSGE
jgi:TetR/AcrR family transcriptional regulator